MNKPLALAVSSLLVLAIGEPLAMAAPGHVSPDFTLVGSKSLKSLRGQPVVVIVAPSPHSRAFRKQVTRLEKDYQGFAARGTVFVAAFTENAEGLRSSIPFVVAKNGAGIATSLGVTTPFTLAVIGKDGNVDLQTTKVSGTSQVRDAVLNNAELQAAERRL